MVFIGKELGFIQLVQGQNFRQPFNRIFSVFIIFKNMRFHHKRKVKRFMLWKVAIQFFMTFYTDFQRESLYIVFAPTFRNLDYFFVCMYVCMCVCISVRTFFNPWAKNFPFANWAHNFLNIRARKILKTVLEILHQTQAFCTGIFNRLCRWNCKFLNFCHFWWPSWHT